MLDINLFRVEKGGDPEKVRESQRRRFANVGLVDEVIEVDKKWREAQFNTEQLRKDRNALQPEMTAKAKAKENYDDLKEKAKEIEDKIKKSEEVSEELRKQVDEKLHLLGNLVHESVPVFNDEAKNGIVRVHGTHLDVATLGFTALNHVDLMNRLDWIDCEQGSLIAGGRGYFLRNEAVLLNQALISYGLGFLHKRGYMPLHTPFFMEKSMMMECAQLSQFDEELYHVSEVSRQGGEPTTEKYLIATSEQPISCYHFNQRMESADLPKMYAGFSTCFRKEAGSHGKDTKGIFRIHQFEKIEQFAICSPDDNISWETHEKMIKTAEEFYQSLGLSYQVINIVSGALNDAAAKKYDLEAWFPASKAFRELVSCSNCTDFQSRRLGTKYFGKGGNERETKFVHMLNATLCATERAMCCIVENYQTETGVKIPEVLWPWMHGITEVPFRKPLVEEKKKDAGKKK